MKTSLCYLKRSVWGVAMLGAITFTNAQQSGQINGKQVYRDINQLYNGHTKTSKSKTWFKVGDNAIDRANHDFERLKDPSTGKIPEGIVKFERDFSSKIAISDDSKKSLATAAKSSKAGRFEFWKNRGPWNVGGRTRALAIDRRNENVILAGGVSGGLWRSENGGESWRKVTRSFQNPSITAIIQDPRPGRSFTWYYASGERQGNSAGAGGAFYQGSGIYKSQDGGRTWEQLRGSDDNDPRAFGPLDLINSIAIDPTTGDLYVGTITGVQRSQDGGNTFTEVLSGGFDTLAEVTISSTGQIYATMDSGSAPNNGYFTSADGDTWTEITPDFLPEAYGRSVMGIDPSNEDVVYFFTANQTDGIAADAFLHRYNASAEEEERWTDLTANLPGDIGSRGGTFNIQGGYDMVVKVSPSDSNLVFVAGTNLYRSTTGFTTPAGAGDWIAGYSSATPNAFNLYTDNHPDQHALVFYPSNPNRVLTGHDGGVSVTEDITAANEGEPVTWTSLSNGYLTTQPYHVSFDPEANSDDLLAGFQDNSTWYTNSTDPRADWVDLFGGDGAYSAIADGGRTRYVSSQRGNIVRFNYNEAGEEEAFTSITPAGAAGFAFIAPFVLDPNNDNIMYLPAGNRIWRNNDLDGVPLFNNSNATVNWVNVTTSAVPAGTVTSLDVSKFPVANRLYYGTSAGTVFRMDNANVDGQEAIDLTTGKGLPEGAFVNDINVDPSNSDRVIITFSNYRVQSLFITEDGGETWTNISGNLEENADGSGNGPSVRSTAFLGGSQGFFGARLQRVFAATSTGLYTTNRLNGTNTVWRKENVVIGTAVTDEVVTRKDGFIAVAAHGSGLFSARFPIFNELPEASLSVAYLLDDITIDIENPGTPDATIPEEREIDVTDLFVQSNGNAIDIAFENSNPDVVTATLEGNTIKLVFQAGLDAGDEATISLVATSGEEQVSEGFTIRISERPVYQQNGAQTSAIISQNNALGVPGAIVQVADDFVVPEGTTWSIERILGFGTASGGPRLDNATVVIYTNENGIPGEEIFNSGELTPISQPDDTNINLLLPEAVSLENGTYWISIYANIATGRWNWAAQASGINVESHLRDAQDVFGAGATDWVSLSLFGIDVDQIFDIYGKISNGNQDGGSEVAPLIGLDAEKAISVSPNPSTDRFNFNLSNLKAQEKVSIAVYNITGNLVFQRSNLNSQFEWDASAMTRGFYFVRISGDAGVKGMFKLLKN
ncbi:hypothetical protein AWE51_21905 [Aquimarina aggregata]|uniref:Secretion system C-terminal sorting domain-containing protein n=1 Tax=Aquimarina aggregata TaxID=1642818 RepID=A0A163BG30_9FLAO|nr:T9SS type A sorting domain-containing protein [Aquimarina aggregata]KZS41360.1 hypothetical protein AWE51_21905 [Aquimarina aggregata]